MSVSTEWTDVQKLRDICLRWNKAAAMAGYAGSEFIDDPERVFDCVRDNRRAAMDALVRAKKEGKQ